jgi:hypothetical protein
MNRLTLMLTTLIFLQMFHTLTSVADVPVDSDNLSTPGTSGRSWQAFAQLGSDFPLFMGGSVGVRLSEKISLGVGYGFLPKPYAKAIGNAIDRFSDTSGYDNVLVNGTDSNHILRFSVDYHFKGRAGWNLGTRFYSLKADGRENINDVEVLTGTTFPVLKAFLTASGRELLFFSNFSMTVLELHTGYTWKLMKSLFLESTFGVSKVLSSDIELSSSSPGFDASNAGRNAYNDAQTKLDEAISKYGYAPFLSVNLVYEF